MAENKMDELNLIDLQNRFAMADLLSRSHSASGYLEVLVLRKQDVELRMYKETAHSRPHFHIEYKTEFDASYSLDDFSLLAGYVPRKYADPLLTWARENQSTLLSKWEELNVNDLLSAAMPVNRK